MTPFALLLACGDPNQRLDEHVFYDGPQFRLKVVRYYRNIPFSYLGEQGAVMCQSENTTNSPANQQQDSGWRTLGTADAQGSNNAQEVASRVKNDYVVYDDHTLIAKTNALNISFDACGHFINWDPSRLPPSMIDPVEKPDFCAPIGQADCRYYDFEGDRAPQYEQIHITGKGQVSFTAGSPTFKGVDLLRVQTRTNGAVWHVETVGLDAEKPRLKPDIVRSLSVSLLEKGMDTISLMDWFESVLPPRSMLIWPDVLTTCGGRPGTDEQPSPMPCAEIRFNDIGGNSGALFIAMTTDSENRPGEVSFHSGEFISGDRSGQVTSLTGLREHLSTNTE